MFTSMLLVAVLAVTGFGVPLAFAVQALYRKEALLLLFGEASGGAVAVPGSFEQENDVPELPTAAGGVDLGLYTSDGQLLTGRGPTTADAAVLAVLAGAAEQRDRDQLIVVVPVSQDEGVVGAVRASLPHSTVSAQSYRAWSAMGALATAVMIACAALATTRSRHLARPLSALLDDAAVIGTGGEVAPRPSTGIQEIDAVQSTLVDASTRLNRNIGRERAFSADLAHQLRTPLASLRLRLETEQMQPSEHDDPLVHACLDDVDRLQQTIEDLVELARDERPQRGRLHLPEVLADVDRHWRPHAESARRRLLVVQHPLPDVSGSQAAVRQILDVLVDNALTHGEGDILLTTEAVGRGVVLTVQDHGNRQVDADAVFTRRHPSARGSGIGLALARRLADAEGMHLSLPEAGPAPMFRLSIGGDR